MGNSGLESIRILLLLLFSACLRDAGTICHYLNTSFSIIIYALIYVEFGVLDSLLSLLHTFKQQGKILYSICILRKSHEELVGHIHLLLFFENRNLVFTLEMDKSEMQKSKTMSIVS